MITTADALSVWRELIDLVRLIDAVRAQQAQPRAAREWTAGLTALEARRDALAETLSHEPQGRLEAVYARLTADLRSAGPLPELPTRGLMH